MGKRAVTTPLSTRARVWSGTLTTMEGAAFAHAGVSTDAVKTRMGTLRWRSLIAPFELAARMPVRGRTDRRKLLRVREVGRLVWYIIEFESGTGIPYRGPSPARQFGNS